MKITVKMFLEFQIRINSTRIGVSVRDGHWQMCNSVKNLKLHLQRQGTVSYGPYNLHSINFDFSAIFV
jgi:hypothetical protein